MEVVVAVFQIIGSIVATLYGYNAVSRKVDEALKSKVDLSVYQAKVKELHDIINHERDKRVELETEVRLLRQAHQPA